MTTLTAMIAIVGGDDNELCGHCYRDDGGDDEFGGDTMDGDDKR